MHGRRLQFTGHSGIDPAELFLLSISSAKHPSGFFDLVVYQGSLRTLVEEVFLQSFPGSFRY